MTTVLKLNVSELDNQFVQDMKEHYGRAELEIRVHETPEAAEMMSDEQFWEIIELLDWSKEGDDAAVLEPAVQFLSQLPTAKIYQFADRLAQKLWQLDTEAHGQVFLQEEDSDGYLSVDDFLYARCCVVANGRANYEKVLQNPAEMPLDVTFEPLLHLADDAYKRKTGKELLFVPTRSYETYSNRKGWNL